MANAEGLIELQHRLHGMLVQLAEIDAGYAKATAEATTWAIKADAAFADRLAAADQAHDQRITEFNGAAAGTWRQLESEHHAATSALETLASRLSDREMRDVVAAAPELAAEPVTMEAVPRAITSAAGSADDAVRRAWQGYRADAASRRWLSPRVFALVLAAVVVLAVLAAWFV